MDAWGKWFGSLGSAVIDGGNPVGPSSTVTSDGSLVPGGGSNPASGYSLIESSSLADAHQKAAGCPLLKAGGRIEVAQSMECDRGPRASFFKKRDALEIDRLMRSGERAYRCRRVVSPTEISVSVSRNSAKFLDALAL